MKRSSVAMSGGFSLRRLLPRELHDVAAAYYTTLSGLGKPVFPAARRLFKSPVLIELAGYLWQDHRQDSCENIQPISFCKIVLPHFRRIPYNVPVMRRSGGGCQNNPLGTTEHYVENYRGSAAGGVAAFRLRGGRQKADGAGGGGTGNLLLAAG
ncbi:MAG: hypothetical protein ACTFAL_09740 [Candidatus Electronema sp. V4]|uniref:hypothetical protein n=1 Tax=Candidatus Electronema sp. V4 TaxID=3454756 RepID=UPI00405587A0